jgi:hypothetical protein
MNIVPSNQNRSATIGDDFVVVHSDSTFAAVLAFWFVAGCCLTLLISVVQIAIGNFLLAPV